MPHALTVVPSLDDSNLDERLFIEAAHELAKKYKSDLAVLEHCAMGRSYSKAWERRRAEFLIRRSLPAVLFKIKHERVNRLRIDAGKVRK